MQEIILGNCYELIKDLEDNSVDLILVDPPYEISTSQGSGAFGVEKKLNYAQLNHISKGFDFSIFNEYQRVLKKLNLYIFCSRSQILPLLKHFVEKLGCYWTPISWHKDNVVPACNNKYLSDTEYCLYFREKGVPIYGTAETKKTYYVTHTNVKDKKLFNHPTPKPLHIIRNLIINSSKEGDLVLDTFSGSGTTAVACKQLNRRCIAYEKREDYYLISKERLENTIANVQQQTNGGASLQRTLF